MKRSIITVFFLLLNLLLFSRIVTYTEAEQAAVGFMEYSGMSGYSISDNEMLTVDGKEYAYMYFLEPEGYIIVPVTDLVPAVIAYSSRGRLEPDSQYHRQFADFICRDLSGRMKYLDQLKERGVAERSDSWDLFLNQDFDRGSRNFEQWPPEGTTPTGGWLPENWSQNFPYNSFCPMDPVTNNRSLAGCPAVAMGMILNYHQTVHGVFFSDSDDYYHNYAGRQYWIDDDYLELDFPSFTQLNQYLETAEDHFSMGETLENDDRAALTFACGVAAQQVYSSLGSGTFGVDQALQAYEKFNFTGMSLLVDDNQYLYEQMKNNMIDALPVHLAVVTPQWNAGHNLVVDGYNTDDYFHVNFGWNGPYNGWYLIPEELPYDLTVIEGAIVDIEPEGTWAGNHLVPQADLELKCYPNPFCQSSAESERGTGTVISYKLPDDCQVKLSIFNLQGRLVRILVKEFQTVGLHSVTWNGDDLHSKVLPSGIYLYRLETGGMATDAGKLVLLK